MGMKIQTRLSLYSSIVFGVIFTIISMLIFALYYQNAKQSIFTNLKKTSYITAFFHLEEDELNREEFAKIKVQFNELVNNQFYQVYNEQDSLYFGYPELNITPQRLDQIRNERELAFDNEDFFCYGIYYEDNQGDFVVIVREKKEILFDQLALLLWIIIPSLLIGVLAIIFFSKWMANVAYRPFRQVIREVNMISSNDLDVQIESPNTQDELQHLIETFNTLLSKISETFIIQRNFVRYVSHEFKTPLASILGNLEVFSIKDRSPEEYDQLSQTLIYQIYHLENILNTLMVVSDLVEAIESAQKTRIDELIWQITPQLTQRYPNSKVHVDVNINADDESLLFVKTDRTQLLMVLFNLMENAVKYSHGNTVDIQLYKQQGKLNLMIKDTGIGIPADKLKYISQPFYRADNAYKDEGSGVGLSIALRILDKNKIAYTIKSELNIGTEVILTFEPSKV